MAILQFNLSKPDDSSIFRLQDYFTGRQGDSNSHVAIQFLDSFVNGKGKPHVFSDGDSVFLKANNTDRTAPIHIYGTATVTNASLGLVDFYFPSGTFKDVGDFDAFFGISDGQGTTVSTINCVLQVAEDFVDAYINVGPYEDMFADWLNKINTAYANLLAQIKQLYTSNSGDVAALKQSVEAYQKAVDALNAQITAGGIPTLDEIKADLAGLYAPVTKVTAYKATLVNCTSESVYCQLHVYDFGNCKLAVFTMNLKTNELAAGTVFAQFPDGAMADMDGTPIMINTTLAEVDTANSALKVHYATTSGQWVSGTAATQF